MASRDPQVLFSWPAEGHILTLEGSSSKAISQGTHRFGGYRVFAAVYAGRGASGRGPEANWRRPAEVSGTKALGRQRPLSR
jgi:hypothetical protein